jgi:hypothetical protein
MAHAGLLARIRREFQDHPGIVLTFPQVLRLWSLEERDGTEALDALVAEGFLQRIDDLYVWAAAPVPRFRRRHTARDVELTASPSSGV